MFLFYRVLFLLHNYNTFLYTFENISYRFAITDIFFFLHCLCFSQVPFLLWSLSFMLQASLKYLVTFDCLLIFKSKADWNIR